MFREEEALHRHDRRRIACDMLSKDGAVAYCRLNHHPNSFLCLATGTISFRCFVGVFTFGSHFLTTQDMSVTSHSLTHSLTHTHIT